MRHPCPDRFASARGFTLVESIIVLALLSIAAVGIISLQGNIFYGQSGNKDIEVGVQLMQECAEQILATRQQIGYTSVNQDTCSTLGNYSGFGAPSVTVTANNVSGPSPLCPTSVTCCASNSSTCTVAVTLSKTGTSLTHVILQLVNY